MSHLRLVPPLAADVPAESPFAAPRTAPSIPLQPSPFDDPKVVALSFFQAASGLCLCRACSMKRHPSYGG
ncbi:MAG TPA: hypothetical protein VGX28_13300 [Frankiaceae bacterium]|nr:hypothetical protein [Frankiaceae bacterium]